MTEIAYLPALGVHVHNVREGKRDSEIGNNGVALPSKVWTLGKPYKDRVKWGVELAGCCCCHMGFDPVGMVDTCIERFNM